MSPADMAERWNALWNGNLGLADTLLTDDFLIHFAGADAAALAGDAVRGPAQLATYIDGFRAARPGLRYTVESSPVGDATGFAYRWGEAGDIAERSGIDLVRVDGERIAEVWSVVGGRRFA